MQGHAGPASAPTPRAAGEGRTVVALRCVLNGRPVECQVEAHTLLIDWLRHEMGLTGTKLGCDEEVCGACTVLLDGQPVSACTTLALEARGKHVLTVEGLAGDDGLHPVQEAFVECFAFQCGYCTPGMLMATLALLQEQPQPSDEVVRHYLSGNLCRCTGYQKIREAVRRAADKLACSGEGGARR